MHRQDHSVPINDAKPALTDISSPTQISVDPVPPIVAVNGMTFPTHISRSRGRY